MGLLLYRLPPHERVANGEEMDDSRRAFQTDLRSYCVRT
jgi:hypothetical protein